jgi:type IV secretory pathway protease TraF
MVNSGGKEVNADEKDVNDVNDEKKVKKVKKTKSRRMFVLDVVFMVFAVFMAIATAIITAAVYFKWSLNLTTCMPVGFYARVPAPANLNTLKNWDRVFFCPPVKPKNPAMQQAISGLWLEHAMHGKWHCADNLMPFAKFIVALPGQTVKITRKGVRANGVWLPNSRIVRSIEFHKIKVIHLPYGTYIVPKGFFWDYAPGNFAYTSAYYGPVPIKSIIGELRPVPLLTIPGSQFWLKTGGSGG